MANPFLLSDEVLSDVVDALQEALGNVTADEMRATPVADDLAKVQQWLDSARASLEAAMQGQHAVVPAFPISGSRLRALEAEIEVIVARREGDRVVRRAKTPSMHTPLHLRLLHSMRHLDRAWSTLVSLSGLSLLLLVVALLTRDRAHTYALVANLAVTGAAIGVGAWSFYFHLPHHRALIYALQPFLKHSIADTTER